MSQPWGLVTEIGGAALWRRFSQNALHRSKQRSRIFPRDPNFRQKLQAHFLI